MNDMLDNELQVQDPNSVSEVGGEYSKKKLQEYMPCWNGKASGYTQRKQINMHKLVESAASGVHMEG